MNRTVRHALPLFFLIACAVGCNKNAPSQTAAIGNVPLATAAPETKPLVPAESPYKKTLAIFQEFARLVEDNQQNPDQGVAKCRAFVAAKAPELKTLTAQIKTIETGSKAADFMQEIMDSNEKIKSATDTVTGLAQAKYGTKGADLMLILSDLALARL